MKINYGIAIGSCIPAEMIKACSEPVRSCNGAPAGA